MQINEKVSKIINKTYFVFLFFISIIFFNDFYISNVHFNSILAISILIIIKIYYLLYEEKKKIFINNRTFLIYILIFLLLLFLSFFSNYTFNNFNYYFLRPGNIIKSIIFSLIGYLFFSKFKTKSIEKIIIFIGVIHFINMIIFFSCQSIGKTICSSNYILDSLFKYLLNFSKVSTSANGHFPLYNQTNYYWLVFMTLYFSLFIIRNKLLSLILFAISSLKIQSFSDISSFFFAFILIIIFLCIKKKDFFFKFTIIIIFFFSTLVVNYKFFFNNTPEIKKVVNYKILGVESLSNIKFESVHKINHRYKEILAILNCSEKKKIFYSFDKIDFQKTNFYLCLEENKLINKVNNELFFHNIILNIIIISNIYICLIIIFLVFLLIKNIAEINPQLLIIPFASLMYLITDSHIITSNSMWIFIGYNFYTAKKKTI